MTIPLPPGLVYPVGVRDLRRILGSVSGQTVTHYRRAGMPRIAHGLYDALACLRWRIAHLEARDRSASLRYKTAELQGRIERAAEKQRHESHEAA